MNTRFLGASCLIAMASALALADTPLGPGWHQRTALPVNPAGPPPEPAPPEGPQRGPLDFTDAADAITPEIAALAAGLLNDPLLIYEFVRDTIDYEPYYGTLKGATLTLLERGGNDFDQAALLVALLRQAGHTANYRFGTMDVPLGAVDGLDANHWLKGADNQQCAYIISSGGIPLVWYSTFLRMNRVWVVATIGGTDYLMDPAFKVYERPAGIDLAAATGYDRQQLLDAAGGTVTADSVQGVSKAAVRAKLAEYAGNLVDHIRANMPNCRFEDVTGGALFAPMPAAGLSTSLRFPADTQATWSSIPDTLATTVRFQLGSMDVTLPTHALHGRRVSLTFLTGSSRNARLWLDDEIRVSEGGSVGTAPVQMTVTVNHPYAANAGTYQDQYETASYQRNGSYAILYGFGGSQTGGLLKKRQWQLDTYRAQGLADDSREVRTESLNVAGLDWMRQTGQANRVMGDIARTFSIHHHRFGRMGQEQGYYVDVALQSVSELALSSNSTVDEATFRAGSLFASAMEHGVIEQLQDNPSASTVKMLQVANDNGDTIYQLTDANFATVWNQIRSNGGTNPDGYPDGLGPEFEWITDNGGVLVLPESYSAAVEQWNGTGYIQYFDYGGGGQSQGMIIYGGYHGGYGGISGDIAPGMIVYDYQSGSYYFIPEGPSFRNPTSNEPVDLYSGSYLLDVVDLQSGGEEPRGLALTRHYLSRKKVVQAGLGNGWSHSYIGGVRPHSATEAAMGTGAGAVDGALFLTALHAGIDLMAEPDEAVEWLLAALAAGWGVDALDGNAVTVVIGRKSMQFIRLADGSYNPPAGIRAELRREGGRFVLDDTLRGKVWFDDQDRLEAIEDLDGSRVELDYDADTGLLASVSDHYGRTLSFAYQGDLLTTVTETAGALSRSVSYDYDGIGNLTACTDAGGHQWSYEYDGLNRMVRLASPSLDTLAVNEYDGIDRVVLQHSRGMDGATPERSPHRTWSYHYSGYGTTEVDPLGRRTTHYFDDHGRKIAVRNPLGSLTRYDYDGQDHLVRLVDPRGVVTEYEYDGVYQVNPAAVPGANHNLRHVRRTIEGRPVVISREYDSFNRLAALVDAAGNRTGFTYHADHRLHEEIAPAPGGEKVTYTYFGSGPHRGLLQARTDPNGNTTSYTYDAFGHPDLRTQPGGLVTDYDHSPRGDLLRETDGAGKVVAYAYDDRRLLLTTTHDPAGLAIAETSNYDANGNLLSAANRHGQVTGFDYDALGLLARITYPNTGVVAFERDRLDREIAATDRRGRRTGFAHDAAGRQTEVVSPAGDSVVMGYDAAGNLVTLTDERGGATTFEYNELNLPTKFRTELGFTTRREHDDRGLLAKVTEPSGQVMTINYDEAGRLRRTTDPVGQIDHSVAFGVAYDGAKVGLRHVISEGGGQIVRQYDGAGRLWSFTDSTGNTLRYEYYANDLLRRITYPDGVKTVTYHYDNANRLSRVVDWAGRETLYEYHPAMHASRHRLWRMTRPNLTRRLFTYDTAGNLTGIREETSVGTVIHEGSYVYDIDGKLVGEATVPPPVFKSAPGVAMQYDADNRLISFNGQSLSHDGDGNLTSGPLGGATAAFSYDARNRLVGAGTTGYTYDAENRRLSMTAGGVTTNYVHNPAGAISQLLQQTTSGPGGTRTTYYVHDIQGLIYEVDDEGTPRYHHSDLRGSTVALTDAAQAVTGTVAYEVFGGILATTGVVDTPFLYHGRTGVMTDPNGLCFMRNRYYHPELRRFLNPDPLGFLGGRNLYQFVGNNPAMRTDSTGLWFGIDDLIFAGGGALLGIAAQGVVDLISGKVSDWEDYAAAAVGGAVGGETLLYTANPFLAGAAGGASSNLTKQGLKLLTGKQEEFSVTSLAVDTALGTATGFIPGPKIPGITSGRNSSLAIYKTILTKAQNGTISQISTKTAFKMAQGAFAEFAVPQGAAITSGLPAIWGYFFDSSGNPVPIK